MERAGEFLSRGAARTFLAALALHALLYAASLRNEFTFDDEAIVVSGPEVNGLAPLAGVFLRPSFPRPPGWGLDYRPVTLTSLGLDVRLFGLAPGALRAENVLLAAVGAALFCRLVVVLGATPAVAAATLLLLSCHPVRSEAILSAVGRSELLVLTFVSGALLLARRSWSGPAGVPAALASGLAVGAALLSKENAFSAPFLLVLVAASDPGIRSAPDWRLALRRLAPVAVSWAVVFAAVFLLRRSVLGGFLTGPFAVIDPIDNLLAAMAPSRRVPAALGILPLGAVRLLWPATLCVDYGSAALRQAGWLAPAWAAVGAVLVVVAVGICLLLWRRHPLAALGLGWVLVTWLPFANIFFPTGFAFAERVLYLPSAGIALVGGLALASAVSERGRLRTGAAAALVVALLLGALRIAIRIPEWRNDRTLFAAAARDYPGNGRAWFDLAVASLTAGQPRAAGDALRAAMAADPAFLSRAKVLAQHAARIGAREAEAELRRVLPRPAEEPVAPLTGR